ncbi:MAG: hypothetical protein IKT00_12620 [Prevotella sp.]|nr:hypothetical protein [Prevotella sp.]
MIDKKLLNRITGIEKLPESIEKDFHDSEILYINYSPGDYNGQADIALKTWSHEDDETQDIVVVFHLEDIREFHIDNQICNFTTCLTIEENDSQHIDFWKGCMDFLLDEISVRISARAISIVSVEPFEE